MVSDFIYDVRPTLTCRTAELRIHLTWSPTWSLLQRFVQPTVESLFFSFPRAFWKPEPAELVNPFLIVNFIGFPTAFPSPCSGRQESPQPWRGCRTARWKVRVDTSVLLGGAELAALAPVALQPKYNTPAVLQKNCSSTTLDATESSVAHTDGKMRLLVFDLRQGTPQWNDSGAHNRS